MKQIGIFARLLNPNVGHTLMHDGVMKLVKQSFSEDVEFVVLEQHQPMTSLFGEKDFLSIVDRLPDWPPYIGAVTSPLKRLLMRPGFRQSLHERVLPELRTLDAAIAVGGPSLIAGISRSAQIQLMMILQHGALKHHGVPMLNLSMGSCFPYYKEKGFITDPEDARVIAGILGAADVNTVRDPAAVTAMSELGHDVPMIPCPALSALEDGAPPPESGGKIVMNFMDRWPLSEPQQADRTPVDPRAFRETFLHVHKELGKEYDIVISCHNNLEVKLIREMGIDPASIVMPESVEDFQNMADGCVAAMASRIHCAIPLASAGVSTLVVGTDTRLKACEIMGLKSIRPNEMKPDEVLGRLKQMIDVRMPAREALLKVKQETTDKYIELLRQNIR